MTAVLVLAIGLDLIGAVAIGVGLWSIYVPAAWIWGGLCAFVGSYLVEVMYSRAAPRAN